VYKESSFTAKKYHYKTEGISGKFPTYHPQYSPEKELLETLDKISYNFLSKSSFAELANVILDHPYPKDMMSQWEEVRYELIKLKGQEPAVSATLE
jgi:hypothetical protein